MSTDPAPAREARCAVVVTYHPDDELPTRIARISAQVSRVYVVDNASNEAARRMLADVAQSDRSVQLILIETNEGIGAALNRGCDRAIADGYAWVVTLDQDSEIDVDMVEELVGIWREHPDREHVKYLAPNYVMGAGVGIRLPADVGRWCERSTAITSGALVSLEAYRRIGPFRADYFIDSVDEEWCLRLRRQGDKVVCSSKPLMRHSLGNARNHRMPWGEMAQSHHAAFRRYYITRNRLLTVKEFGLREPRWALMRLWYTMIDFVAVPLLEAEKSRKVRAMSIGLWHGLIGRTGKADRAF